MAQKAETFVVQPSTQTSLCRKRSDNTFGGNTIICYTGVLLWLFQAGFTTLKWYVDNMGMNANNCNAILGNGVEIDPATIDNIPRGFIWNFQGIRPQVCHWGISLGHGKAAGTNNHQQEGTKAVDFEPGGGLTYGRFTLQSQYEVLKLKYGSASIKDPSGASDTFVAVNNVKTKLFIIDPTAIVFPD